MTDPAPFPSALSTLAAPFEGPRPSPSRPTQPAGPEPQTGLAPGEILAGRYRIAGLLGRGGMGEVYRADDLKLGQPVALKFLSREVEADPRMLDRLHAEVRNARQVSHPYVCRVHDIDDADGRHFITMEYVDGEDLSTLLRRIGRLPEAKAVEIARQVSAGLQAIHDRGVVHRDLKPGNVMIDGHGRARITDFGLAVSGAQRAGEVAGTPAYMAPEQLAGAPATPQADIYALGLLLYETCTGKRPFEARTMDEWRRAHTQDPPASPGLHARGLDEAVERVILRCLEKDPARRPRSAAQVALALPGGDPLAAAIAAGETPSPEMVAAAGHGASMRPGLALAALAGICTLLVALAWTGRVNAFRRVPFERSAEVLADRASSLIADLGIRTPPRARAWAFRRDNDYVAWSEDPLAGAERWRRLRAGQPLVYSFWYRQSPVPLEPLSFAGNRGEVTLDDPPAEIEGMASVLMDPRGRVVEFRAVPEPTRADRPEPATAEGLAILFRAAGLNQASFAPAAPSWTPPGFADRQAAFAGAHPDHPDLAIRVEAAFRRGRPTYFRVVAPWDQPPGHGPERVEGMTLASGIIAVVLVMTVVLGALLLARKNLRLGRGDRRGALRIAAACGAAASTAVLLRFDLPLTLRGVVFALFVLANVGLLWGAVIWTSYLALEPYVRRNRPQLIVSWSRLLAGELRDPALGRDLLLGLLLGLGMTAAGNLSGWVKVWTGHPLGPNDNLDDDTLNGVFHAVATALEQVNFGVWLTFAVLVFLILARKVVRRDWAAALLLWAALLGMEVLFVARSWPAVAAAAITLALTILVVARLGLVAGVAAWVAFYLTAFFPLTSDLSAPYAGAALVGVASIATAALWGFRISLGNRRTIDLDRSTE